MAEEDLWIFGYGSLIWKTNFPYKEKVVGQIRGYARRFWQGSTDHRGVPGKPGRVVTLVEDQTVFQITNSTNPQENVTGISFKVDRHMKEQVLEYLDYREKGGYQLVQMLFYPDTDNCKPFNVQVYLATEKNPNYLGPATERDIAQQIIKSNGPSGSNLEYFLKLIESLEQLGPSHVNEHLKQISIHIENTTVCQKA